MDEFNFDEISKDIREKEDVDMGYMLYRMNFKDKGIPQKSDWDNPVFSDEADAVYYRPHMKKGIIDVKEYIGGTVC